MANRARQRAMRRNQVIMGIFALLLVLSMVISLVWSFSAPTPAATSNQSQPQPTTIIITPAP